MRKYCIDRGIGQDIDTEKWKTSIHSVRHSFALEFAKSSGGDIMRLQKLLGHSTLAMTRNYVKIPCAMNEDEAREYIQTFFDYREKQELARELAQDNWQYDYTEITEIYFNMGMINFIKRIIPEIDNAIKLALR